MILRSIPKKGRHPSYTGRVMIDSFRGVLRVRKWPKKRGTPRSALQRWWVDWFVQANLLAKYADPMSQARAIEMSKDSGMYPRDVLLKAMRGRLYFWSTTDGWKWYSMAAVMDVSNSLDALAQTVGDVLVRATDRWRAPPAGAAGQVLTHQGAADPPIWLTPAGGLIQEELPGSPVVLDNTASQYDFDVSDYLDLWIVSRAITLAASQSMWLRVSVDGGATFKAAATDYTYFFVTAVAEGSGMTSVFAFSDAASAANHQGVFELKGLRAPLSVAQSSLGTATSSASARGGATLFTGPITDIRIMTSGGANFTGGTLRLFGTKPA